MSGPFFTIGHSNRSIDLFLDLLRGAQIGLLVDVRSLPGSRANPQFDEERLRESLSTVQIGYLRLPGLGGLRGRQRSVHPSPNGLWRVRSFQNYADHALGEAFARDLAALRRAGETQRVAIMCAEAVWWRCHRRIVADHLLARVNAGYRLLAWGTMPIGAALGGLIAERFEVTTVFWTSATLGVLCLPIILSQVTTARLTATDVS